MLQDETRYVTLTKDMVDVAKSFREKNKDQKVSLASGCILAQLGMAALGRPVGAGFDRCNGTDGGTCQFEDMDQAHQLVALNDNESWDKLYSLVGLEMKFGFRSWNMYQNLKGESDV